MESEMRPLSHPVPLYPTPPHQHTRDQIGTVRYRPGTLQLVGEEQQTPVAPEPLHSAHVDHPDVMLQRQVRRVHVIHADRRFYKHSPLTHKTRHCPAKGWYSFVLL